VLVEEKDDDEEVIVDVEAVGGGDRE